MKRISCIVLALLLFLLAACTPGQDKPEGSTEPTAIATAEPGAAEDPYPTQDPARAAFDPDKDFDNRFASLLFQSMAETEDVYYLVDDSTGFLYYYVKETGENGVLCPRPECMHDQAPKEERQKCSGYVGHTHGTLTIVDGRLYWVRMADRGGDYEVYSMALDGSDRQFVTKLGISIEEYQAQNFWIHRGYVYFFSSAPIVRNGSPTRHLVIARVSMSEGGIHEIFARDAYASMNWWTLRFIGDDVYIQCGYDGADESVFENGEPQTQEELSVLQQNTVILRWNEYMDEPEVLLEEDSLNEPAYDNFMVEPDGTIWFVRHRPEDPSINWWEEGYRRIGYLCRRDPDGTVTEVFDSVIDGEYYYMRDVYDGGMIMIQDIDKKPGTLVMCIVDLEGNVLFKGDMPNAFLERVPSGGFTPTFTHIGCESSGFIVCAEVYYESARSRSKRAYFIRYDLTPEGLRERFLCESMFELTY